MIKYEAKTLEEAILKATKDLNIKENEFVYKKIEKKGGILKKSLIEIEVTTLNEVIEFSKDFLKNILQEINIDVNFETKIRENQITVKMFSDNNSLLIGKNGKNLEALQVLLKQACLIKFGAYVFIILDVENYKDKQIKILERNATNYAHEVLKTKFDIHLENMNSYERRIVHNVLSKYEELETNSEGEEPNRHIVIKYKNKK